MGFISSEKGQPHRICFTTRTVNGVHNMLGTEGEHDPSDQSPAWQPLEVPLGDGRILVLDES